MRKHCSGTGSGDLTREVITARERMSFTALPSEKNHLTQHTEEGKWVSTRIPGLLWKSQIDFLQSRNK